MATTSNHGNHIFTAQPTGIGHEHHVIANCLDLGVGEVTITIGNKPCDTNPYPVEAIIKSRFEHVT